MVEPQSPPPRSPSANRSDRGARSRARAPRRLSWLALLAALWPLAFAGSAAAAPVTVHVGQGGTTFVAPSVTVPVGRAIHWTWDSSDHSVTSGSPPGTPDGVFDSGVQNQGASFDQTFSTPGVYHYFCLVHYAQGMVGTITVVDRPVASFGASPAAPAVGHAVSFNASASSDPDGDAIVSYRWSFGDGAVASASHPVTSHVYASAGGYRATLVVVDVLGNESVAVAHGVQVKGPARPPVARFSFSPSRPLVGQPVSFNGATSLDPDGGRITLWRWQFGDRTHTTATGPLADHTYRRAGTYTVTLVVFNERGAHSTPMSERLTVVAPPPPPPRVSGLSVRACRHRSRSCPRRGLVVRYVLSAGDHLVLTITRRHHRRATRRVELVGRPGVNVVRIRFAHVRSGRFVLRLHADGGNTASVRFRWRR